MVSDRNSCELWYWPLWGNIDKCLFNSILQIPMQGKWLECIEPMSWLCNGLTGKQETMRGGHKWYPYLCVDCKYCIDFLRNQITKVCFYVWCINWLWLCHGRVLTAFCRGWLFQTQPCVVNNKRHTQTGSQVHSVGSWWSWHTGIMFVQLDTSNCSPIEQFLQVLLAKLPELYSTQCFQVNIKQFYHSNITFLDILLTPFRIPIHSFIQWVVNHLGLIISPWHNYSIIANRSFNRIQQLRRWDLQYLQSTHK